MKIIIIGSTGVLGKAVVSKLKAHHEIIEVSHSKGEITVDITDIDSIKGMFSLIGSFDALVATTGAVHFGALENMTPQQWQVGLNHKLMGQVNLVMEGMKSINDNGSFTLSSGMVGQDPIRYGTSLAMVNRAIEGFVEGAAIEMPRGIRINAVCPTLVDESVERFGSYFPGFDSIPAARAALGYRKSIDGLRTGHIFKITSFV